MMSELHLFGPNLVSNISAKASKKAPYLMLNTFLSDNMVHVWVRVRKLFLVNLDFCCKTRENPHKGSKRRKCVKTSEEQCGLNKGHTYHFYRGMNLIHFNAKD